jgi:predicted transcriptional regulator
VLQLFKGLGLASVLVTTARGNLAGIIKKKDILAFMTLDPEFDVTD